METVFRIKSASGYTTSIIVNHGMEKYGKYLILAQQGNRYRDTLEDAIKYAKILQQYNY